MIISNELIFTGKLQLNKLEKLKPEKIFRLRRGLNPCLPDTGWVLPPTELRSHMLGARQILVGSLFPKTSVWGSGNKPHKLYSLVLRSLVLRCVWPIGFDRYSWIFNSWSTIFGKWSSAFSWVTRVSIKTFLRGMNKVKFSSIRQFYPWRTSLRYTDCISFSFCEKFTV